ncbi:hypothetical protein N9J72_02780, partial [Candidatus Gracilibacteria bacterium]|nr:hypothetical protein [Candidatus Gracilibacteria bacterium]
EGRISTRTLDIREKVVFVLGTLGSMYNLGRGKSKVVIGSNNSDILVEQIATKSRTQELQEEENELLASVRVGDIFTFKFDITPKYDYVNVKGSTINFKNGDKVIVNRIEEGMIIFDVKRDGKVVESKEMLGLLFVQNYRMSTDMGELLRA